MNTIEKAIEKLGVAKAVGVDDRAKTGVVEDDVVYEAPDVNLAKASYDAGEVAEISTILRDKQMLNPSVPQVKLVEEYRKIKRPVLLNIANSKEGDYSNLVMVTSSLPGEGKTFSSINLAVSVAMELDKTVLLVDSDVHKPATSQLLGVVDRFGLTDVLVSSDLDLSQVLIKTDIPKVSILSVGCSRDNSNELLASQSMSDLMKELSSRYQDRVIIIDTPPLLATNEAGLIANIVGQILVVVEAEKTSPSILEESLSLLDHERSQIGLILNKARISGKDHQYYGHYGYTAKGT